LVILPTGFILLDHGVPGVYKCGCREEVIRVISGVVLVVLITIAWTGATQFGRSVFKKNFDAPYLAGWFTVCFQVSMYPLFLVLFIGRKEKGKIFVR